MDDPTRQVIDVSDTWVGPVAHAHLRPKMLVDYEVYAVAGFSAGLWGVKSLTALDEVLGYGPRHLVVTGEIELGGHVIEHQLGYRAEKAIVRALIIPRLTVADRAWWKLSYWKRPDDTARICAFEDRYQCPVRVASR
jgi:hypothetical protein